MGCDADLSAVFRGAVRFDDRRLCSASSESRLATRDLTLAIATFIWTGLPCARYDCPLPFDRSHGQAAVLSVLGLMWTVAFSGSGSCARRVLRGCGARNALSLLLSSRLLSVEGIRVRVSSASGMGPG